MRTMYDAVTPGNIPANPQMVAGYSDGAVSKWPDYAWARFSSIPHAVITVTGTDLGADVLDIESGDASPAGSVRWVGAKWNGQMLYPAVLYVNRSNMAEVISAQTAAGFNLGHHYVLWVATLDGTKSLPDMTGVVAVQYHDGGNYDASVVYDDSWMPGLQHATPPPVAEHGIVVNTSSLVAKSVVSTDGGRSWH